MKHRFKNFHEGEARMQASAGVDTAAFDRAVDQPFRPELNPNESAFIDKRTFSVAASLDEHGRPWASPLIGTAGELLVVRDPTTVELRPRTIEGDPLAANVAAMAEMGVLYFDPARRRRAKSLGRGTIEPDGAITYRMHRMFGLCTKYIFKRSHEPDEQADHPGIAPTADDRLSPTDRAVLAASDTIFLASRSERYGTDPTHRGGPAGFVRVLDDTTLAMPDYLGNGMFQTLGNLLLDDRIGLMAMDFSTGRILQVTGRGSMESARADDDHSQRTLVISIDDVRSTWGDVGRWTDIEAFELQPNLVNPATPLVRDDGAAAR